MTQDQCDYVDSVFAAPRQVNLPALLVPAGVATHSQTEDTSQLSLSNGVRHIDMFYSMIWDSNLKHSHEIAVRCDYWKESEASVC